MSDRRPLVLADGQTQQLQPVDDLDIPLNDRVANLEISLRELRQILMLQGIAVPEENT